MSHVAIIGGGPAGLMAADVAARGGVQVSVFDQMPALGRKFLLAGRGGLNLTHSEEFERLMGRYDDAQHQLREAIAAFPPSAVRAWCEELGIETFIGSSGRVFPRAMKASPLLRAWLRRLTATNVAFNLRQRWLGWDGDSRLLFDGADGTVVVHADAVILALGGASWPTLGSDGAWVDAVTNAGIAVSPLRPSNCGFLVAWSADFRKRFEGEPLKRIEVTYGDVKARGEGVITKAGFEGGAAYAIAPALRAALAGGGDVVVTVDLRPDIASADLLKRVESPRKKSSISTFLRKAASLSPAEIGLLHEAAIESGRKLTEMAASEIADLIKAVPIRLTGAAPIARAISSAGGIAFGEIDTRFMLRKRPGVFVAGEMLDWEAPTGGYLLQACFSTGAAAGHGALAWLKQAGQI